jgi:hypothetical protein
VGSSQGLSRLGDHDAQKALITLANGIRQEDEILGVRDAFFVLMQNY